MPVTAQWQKQDSPCTGQLFILFQKARFDTQGETDADVTETTGKVQNGHPESQGRLEPQRDRKIHQVEGI